MEDSENTPSGRRRKDNLRGMMFSVASGFVLMGSFGLARHATAELHAFEVAFFDVFRSSVPCALVSEIWDEDI